jgi:hypothetical protein
MQGNKIDKEGNLASSKEIERNFKILQIVSFNLKNKQQTFKQCTFPSGLLEKCF